MSTTAFITESDITLLFGDTGISLHTDDLSVADKTTFIDSILEEASVTVCYYTQHKYDDADLVNSRWAKTRAVWIAIYLFSQRRGDPGVYEEFYQQALQDLKEVRDGRGWIPGLNPTGNLLPSMQNLKVSHLHFANKIRVEGSTSVGGTSGTTDLDRSQPFFYL